MQIEADDRGRRVGLHVDLVGFHGKYREQIAVRMIAIREAVACDCKRHVRSPSRSPNAQSVVLFRQTAMGFFSTNLFDLAIYVCLFVAVVMGFMTGFLRSLATVFGYVCGMGVAVAAAPRVTPLLTTYLKMPTPQTWLVFVAAFIAAGAVISALLRLAVS